MMSTEKLNAIITSDFDFMAALAEEIDEFGREDEDIEKVMDRHNLEPREAVTILDVMESARYHANARAVNAADKGAAEAITYLEKAGGLAEHQLYDLYNALWRQIHAAVFPVEYKALAKANG